MANFIGPSTEAPFTRLFPETSGAQSSPEGGQAVVVTVIAPSTESPFTRLFPETLGANLESQRVESAAQIAVFGSTQPDQQGGQA